MATMFAPRPPVERPKSGTIDYPDHYSRNAVRWRDALLRQGISELQEYSAFQEAQRTIDLLLGTGWWPANRPGYLSKYFDNHLADVRRESIASLTDIRPNLDISSKVEAYKDQDRSLSSYMAHLWDEEDLDLKVADWIDHALFGTGFLKQVGCEPGDFTFTTHGLDQVIPVLMSGNDLQTSAAVIYKVPQILSYFINKFGKDKCAGLERQSMQLATALGSDRYQRPDSVPEYTWNAMSPQMRRRMALRNGPIRESGGNVVPFPVLELQEITVDDWSVNEFGHDVLVKHPDLDISEHNYHYIVPPGCRLYPRKRLFVFAGDRVMYDGPAPNWHGLYPFTMLQLNPCVFAPGGISKYHDLIPLNNSLNRIGTGVEQSVIRCVAEGTPIWLPDGTIRPVEEVVAKKMDVLTFLDGKIQPTTPTEWHDNGEQETVKVVMASGRSITATKNHRWLTRWSYQYSNGALKVRTTDDLEVGMQLPMPAECKFFGERLGYEDGYLMGAMNGDGWMTGSSPAFVGIPGDGGTEEFVRCAESLGDRVAAGRVLQPSGLTQYTVSKGAFREYASPSRLCGLLREEETWGLSSTAKNLPKQGYSREFYTGYVAGLFDTDGSVILSKGRETISIAGISEAMLRQLSDMLLRFGVYSSVKGPYRQKRTPGIGMLPRFDPKNCKGVWYLRVSDRNSIINFGRNFWLKNTKKQEKLEQLVVAVGRKASRLTPKGRKAAKKYGKRFGVPDGMRFDRIVGIFPAGLQRTYCVTVEPSHLWVVNGIITMQSLAGIWTARRGSIAQDVWDAFDPRKPNQKVLLNPNANPAVDFIEKQAPALPPQVEMWSRYLLEAIKRRSGVLDVSGLSRKNQVPGADTLAQMQDTMSAPFRLEGRYVESALKRAGRQAVSNIIQYTTTDQRLRVLGADGISWADFTYEVTKMANMSSPREDHWRMFSIRIAQGSTHGTSRFAREVTAFNLFRSGGLSLHGLYRQLNFPESVDQVIQEIMQERQMEVGPAGRVLRQKRSERTGSAT